MTNAGMKLQSLSSKVAICGLAWVPAPIHLESLKLKLSNRFHTIACKLQVKHVQLCLCVVP